jgi:hypothetical protein
VEPPSPPTRNHKTDPADLVERRTKPYHSVSEFLLPIAERRRFDCDCKIRDGELTIAAAADSAVFEEKCA